MDGGPCWEYELQVLILTPFGKWWDVCFHDRKKDGGFPSVRDVDTEKEVSGHSTQSRCWNDNIRIQVTFFTNKRFLSGFFFRAAAEYICSSETIYGLTVNFIQAVYLLF